MAMGRVLAGVAIVALLAAGCSSTDSGGNSKTNTESGSAAKTSNLTVGTIPISSNVSAYLAQDKGYFKEHQLNVELKSSAGFAPILASVLNGEQQVGFASIIPVLVAKSKGAPIKILCATDFAHSKSEEDLDPAWVFVPQGSTIKNALDLQGKTVGVNALGSSQDLNIKMVVKQAGGDPAKVKFLVLPPQDTVAAAQQGRIDAAAVSEPFTSQALELKMTGLFPYASRGMPDQVVGVYFASDKVLSTQGKQIADFVAAIKQATDLAGNDRDAVTQALAGYTTVPAERLTKMRNFLFKADITTQDVEALSTVLLDYKFMDKPVTAKDILWQP
jgi:NitT/TauT family transport system substrate-binding protein